jgi:hypothetical protein
MSIIIIRTQLKFLPLAVFMARSSAQLFAQAREENFANIYKKNYWRMFYGNLKLSGSDIGIRFK